MPCCFRCGAFDCGREAVLTTKGIWALISARRPSPSLSLRSSRTVAHPGVFSGLDLIVSLVSWMLILLLWMKIISSVIFHRFRLRSIASVVDSYRVLVSSPVQCTSRNRRHTEVEVGAAIPSSVTPPPITRFDVLRNFGSYGCRQCRKVIRPR